MNSGNTQLRSVKEEYGGGEREGGPRRKFSCVSPGVAVVDLSSSSSSDDDSENEGVDSSSGRAQGRKRRSAGKDVDGNKRSKGDGDNGTVVLPAGFLDPLPPVVGLEHTPTPPPPRQQQNLTQQRQQNLQNRGPSASAQQSAKKRSQVATASQPQPVGISGCKQFWKAGDYEGNSKTTRPMSGAIDHVRVHPKFLHSNATSHKWALGAFAELLDNSLDEACNGATFVNIDMVLNQKDGSPMLLIEDDGGGMDPDKMRSCMSLGYSAKSKVANMIGQYGNGFKTSTMRLGADVIVFSRCRGTGGKSCSQSIGLLSYTFLRITGLEDIVVPMVDYEIQRDGPRELIRSSANDWYQNLETLQQWSPYASEAELIRQFDGMREQGTRIILYNLWENDQGELELDFDTDVHDIQVRGANRDEKMIKMAQSFPNSRHYLTYKHSLRSYASILYLRLPVGFRIILRGKDVEHHNLVDDLMHTQEITYKPQGGSDISHKENNVVVVTIGFVKDAKDHIDIQGFNVYHKNRLIKPFWRIWNPAGSDGRGVIGILEANFIEPAHDKQGFERTTVLARLESKLIQMQKNYWTHNCPLIGYAPRRGKKNEKYSSKETEASEMRVLSSTSGKKAEKTSVSAMKDVRSNEMPISSSASGNKADKNLVSTTKEIGATEMPMPSSTSGKKVQKNPVSVARVTQVERMDHVIQQYDDNIVQAERQNASYQAQPEVMNLPQEEVQQPGCSGPSLRRLSKSNQRIPELQKRLLQDRNYIVEQQEALQKDLVSSELHAKGNHHLLEAHSISSESPEQLQVTSLVSSVLYSPLNESSDGVASSIPVFRSPNELDAAQINRVNNCVVTATTQMSKVAASITVDGIGPSSKASDAIACAEFGLSSRLQSHVVNMEIGSSNIHEDIIHSGDLHVVDPNQHKQVEDEIIQLKERLKTEIEKNNNLLAHNVALEEKLEVIHRRLEEATKDRENLNAVLSAERLERDLEESELRNKLKNAHLRIQELEQRGNILK